MNIRRWVDADLAAVFSIQLKCPQAAQWCGEDYLRLARASGGTILVAEIEHSSPPEVAGFAAFHRVIDEAELRNLAVDPSHQRMGMARALLEVGIRAMRDYGVRQLFLEVRASNQPALAFYRAAGFQLLYRRADYYSNPVEDALVMGCDITCTSEISSGQK